MRLIRSFVKRMENENNDGVFYDAQSESTLRGLYSNLPKIKPFIFSHDDYFHIRNTIRLDTEKNIFLPFQYCSFEISYPLQFDGNTADSSACHLGVIVVENDDLSIDEICPDISIKDIYGKGVDFGDLKSNIHTKRFRNTRFKDYNDFREGSLSYLFLLLLNSKKTHFGISKNGYSVKRKGAFPEFVKKLVVISSKNNQSKLNLVLAEKIDWKHQWRVRGHWRKISPNMLGKDREGDHVIIGRTWVKDFIKGDGPLIEKTRIKQGETECRA